MNEPREIWALPGQHLGHRVLVYDLTDSTNSRAAALAGDRANDGVAILADEQTAGRGQHGRAWLAPPGSSVLLSLLLFPPNHLNRPVILTAWASVAVCSLVESITGQPARIKWPNDVLVEGQKICGILIEQGQGVVVGIGLNVTQHSEQFTKAGLPSATSLQAQVAHATSTYAAARQLLTVLDNDYKCLCQGMLENLEMDWANHLGLLNQEVEAECLDGNWQGRLVGISFAGLHLKEAASMRTLLPERIQHLRLVAPGEEPIP